MNHSRVDEFYKIKYIYDIHEVQKKKEEHKGKK